MDAITGAESSFEKFLCDKASMTNTPIGATFELTTTCNLNCRMCYVRMDAEAVAAGGGLMPAEFWIQLGEQVRETGTLFILLTGGEPLLYPHFKEVYIALHKLGFVLTVNTNGTLINEEIAQMFHDYQPRRLNISLYGKDDTTYGRMCGNPKGFTQLSKGIALLKKYNVPTKLTCSLTPYNYEDRQELRRIAEKWDLYMEMGYYMFPPARRRSENIDYEQNRMTPEKAAEAAFWVDTYGMDPEIRNRTITMKLRAIDNFDPATRTMPKGFWCRAANAAFWVNYNGTMSPCGMLTEPVYDLKKEAFSELWPLMIEENKQIRLSEDCLYCNKYSLCLHCGSSEMAENGHYGSKIDYLCRFCDCYYEILKREADKVV